MLVYGVRCAPADLVDLPSEAQADFYLDYGLLVFPTYTRPTTLVRRRTQSDNEFWSEAARVIAGRVHVEEHEHPFITAEEHAVVSALREMYPTLETDWFHVPRVA